MNRIPVCLSIALFCAACSHESPQDTSTSKSDHPPIGFVVRRYGPSKQYTFVQDSIWISASDDDTVLVVGRADGAVPDSAVMWVRVGPLTWRDDLPDDVAADSLGAWHRLPGNALHATRREVIGIGLAMEFVIPREIMRWVGEHNRQDVLSTRLRLEVWWRGSTSTRAELWLLEAT